MTSAGGPSPSRSCTRHAPNISAIGLLPMALYYIQHLRCSFDRLDRNFSVQTIVSIDLRLICRGRPRQQFVEGDATPEYGRLQDAKRTGQIV